MRRRLALLLTYIITLHWVWDLLKSIQCFRRKRNKQTRIKFLFNNISVVTNSESKQARTVQALNNLILHFCRLFINGLRNNITLGGLSVKDKRVITYKMADGTGIWIFFRFCT